MEKIKKDKNINYEIKFEKNDSDEVFFDINDYWKVQGMFYNELLGFVIKPILVLTIFLIMMATLKFGIISGKYVANELLKSTQIEKTTESMEMILQNIRKSGWASPKAILIHVKENNIKEPTLFNLEGNSENNFNNISFSNMTINKVPNSDEISINYSNVPTKECENLSLKTFKEETTKKIKINNNEAISMEDVSVSYISEGCSLASNNISFIN